MYTRKQIKIFTGVRAARRAAVSAVALLAIAAVLLAGSGHHSPATAQVPGFEPGVEAPMAPGSEQFAPGLGNPPAPAEQVPPIINHPHVPVTPETATESTLEIEPYVEPGNNLEEMPLQPSETATAGYLGLGLLPNVHYPPDRIIIRYKERPLGVVNELSTSTAETLLSEIEAQQIGIAVSEDIAGLEDGFNISSVEVTGGVPERNTYFLDLQGEGNFDPLEVSFALSELDSVEYAQPDYYLEPAQTQQHYRGDCLNDPYASPPYSRWGRLDLCADEDFSWYIRNINLDDAQRFAQINRGSNPSPLVAVIDLGFHRNTDLDNRWFLPAGELLDLYSSRENPNDMSTDNLNPSSSAYGQRDSNPFGGSLHGTQVAGVLTGRKNNGYGAYGVYQNSGQTILPLKIFPDEYDRYIEEREAKELSPTEKNVYERGYVSGAIEAIKIATKHDAKVINGSFGTYFKNIPNGELCSRLSSNFGTSQDPISGSALRDAIADFPGLYVASAGNDGMAIGSTYFHSPAGFTQDVLKDGPMCMSSINKLDNLISVAATRLSNTRTGEVALADFSNYSSDHVQIAAPGENIFAPGGGTFRHWRNVVEGTSFAAPMVAGTAALMLQVNPHLTPKQMIRIINFTGRHQRSLNGKVAGGKTLDAHEAVYCAAVLLKENSASFFGSTNDATFETEMRESCVIPVVGFRTIGAYGVSATYTTTAYIGVTNGVVPKYDITLEVELSGRLLPRVDYSPFWRLRNAKEWYIYWSRSSQDRTRTITIPAGRTWVAIEIPFSRREHSPFVSDLVLGISHPSVYANISWPGYRYESEKLLGNATIIDREWLLFGFRPLSARGLEQQSSLIVDVASLHGITPNRSYSFNIERGGTATPGVDYANELRRWNYQTNRWGAWEEWTSGTYSFTIAPQQDNARFEFRIYDDDEGGEGLETLTLKLVPPYSWRTHHRTDYTYTIIDDD